ncbi:MAG: hypothetical protein Q7T16_02365 [Candidatus Burarchaeum sp.]|nr:hypothetical protein [Candidatus Burarchaeum sp.]MDO8339478.1 hypothetical protein [Candidatus Burarchaeum sp.]
MFERLACWLVKHNLSTKLMVLGARRPHYFLQITCKYCGESTGIQELKPIKMTQKQRAEIMKGCVNAKNCV